MTIANADVQDADVARTRERDLASTHNRLVSPYWRLTVTERESSGASWTAVEYKLWRRPDMNQNWILALSTTDYRVASSAFVEWGRP